MSDDKGGEVKGDGEGSDFLRAWADALWSSARPRKTIPLTQAQIEDIVKILERINQEHNGYGQIVITIKKGKIVAIGSLTEWRYE